MFEGKEIHNAPFLAGNLSVFFLCRAVDIWGLAGINDHAFALAAFGAYFN